MTVVLSRSIGGIPLDVVMSETHKAEMEIAEHPVERGAKISDHAWRKPYSVEMECVVAAPGAMGAYESLLRLQEDAEPFDLVTGLKVYSNMLIKDLSAKRDKEKARILSFTATLQEVIIVSTSGGGGALSGGGLGAFGGLLGGASSAIRSITGGLGSSVLSSAASAVSQAQSLINRGEVQMREVLSTAPAIRTLASVFR